MRLGQNIKHVESKMIVTRKGTEKVDPHFYFQSTGNSPLFPSSCSTAAKEEAQCNRKTPSKN